MRATLLFVKGEQQLGMPGVWSLFPWLSKPLFYKMYFHKKMRGCQGDLVHSSKFIVYSSKFWVISRLVAINDGKISNSAGMILEGPRSQGFKGSSELLKNYKELNVWQKSFALFLKIYSITADFPDEERYGLTSQIVRSAVSIPFI